MKVGDTYHAVVNGRIPHKIHIVAIVDNDQIVYKYFGRYKQWWFYDVEDKELLEWKIERSKNRI